MPDLTGAWMGGMAGWMMLMMILVPLLVIGLVALIFAGVIRAGRTPPQDAATDPPLTILQRRYARGDIRADEYERIRSALTGG